MLILCTLIEDILKMLFIVSEAKIVSPEEANPGCSSEWVHSGTFAIPSAFPVLLSTPYRRA